MWNANRIAGDVEAMDVAIGLAAIALAVLCTVLCWYAWPYLVAETGAGADQEEDLLP